jgi:hypothetical protein
MFVLAMMPVQGGNTVTNSPSRQQCCCILLSTQAFAQVARLVGKLAVGRNLQLRFGSALKHHRLNIAGSSRGFPQEQRQVTFDSTGALYFEGLKQVPDPRSAVLCSNPRLETTVPRQKPGQFSKLAIADSQGRILAILLPGHLALLARPGSRRRALSSWI